MGCQETYNGAVPNLVDVNYSDKMSSRKIQSDSTWMFYQHVDYQRALSIICPGEYPNSHRSALDSLSSLLQFLLIVGSSNMLFKDSSFPGSGVAAI